MVPMLIENDIYNWCVEAVASAPARRHPLATPDHIPCNTPPCCPGDDGENLSGLCWCSGKS